MKQNFLIILLIFFPFISIFGELTKDSFNSTITPVETLTINLSESGKVAGIIEDTIEIEKKFGEIYGFRNDQLLTHADYKTLFANSPDALKNINSSKFLHNTGKFFGYVGGYMFGFIGVMGLKDISSVDYTWGIALGSSAAIIGVGYLFYSLGNNSQNKAINIYNNNQRKTEDKEKFSLKIGITNSGVGLVCSF